MIPYATTTRTRRNIAAMRAAGWRLLLTPAIHDDHGLPYALDNGAWGAFQRGVPWDADAFCRLVDRYGAAADFIVLPDIVGGGLLSLARSLAWLERLRPPWRRLLLPVQDGVHPVHVASVVGATVGLFVGGSTAWKLWMLPDWADLARRTGCYLHVGRVNTARRIRLCQMAGADSIDGTSVTRYAVTLPKAPPRGFAATWSCYSPSLIHPGTPCGRCDACVLRAEALT
jgi:hypothetical protein